MNTSVMPPPMPRRFCRALHGGVGLVMAGALVVCALLTPAPSGVGTHKRLGLPGCLVCAVTGMKRCPSCGLTTAFCYLMRGQWRQARAVHPAAPVVFIVWWLVMAWCFVATAIGKDPLRYEIPALAALCITALAFWLAAL